jgi:predicted metal-binding protein
MTLYKSGSVKHRWEIVSQDLDGFKTDMKEICDKAVKKGASWAELIEASKIVTDNRVTLKCRIPPCEAYGRNLMCPPYSPTAEQTREVISWYKYGILLAVEMRNLPDEFWNLIQQEDATMAKLFLDPTFVKYELLTETVLVRKLHELVNFIEREAHNRGYFYAVGYSAYSCTLCLDRYKDRMDQEGPWAMCDVTKPCIRPYEARPSMEASGIDVYATYRNIGKELPMASKNFLSATGLVLIV